MLLQTNSYVVPKEKRAEHARLVMRFRQTLARLGCEHFEAYEQVGANWSPTDATGRFVHIMRFRDRKHQQQVQSAEKNDPSAQALIKEFCELINFPYQQQQGLFAVGYYTSALAVSPSREPANAPSASSSAAPTISPPPAPPDVEVELASPADHFDEPSAPQTSAAATSDTPATPSEPPTLEDLDLADLEVDPSEIDPSVHRS